MQEYRFKSMSKVCAATGRLLRAGEPCFSVLIERHGVQERLDYAADAWTGLPEHAIGVWRSVAPAPIVRQAATADPELLLRHFEQLMEDPSPLHERLAYVLALYLLQRRRLKLEDSRVEEDGEYLQLSGSRGEGPFSVRDQQLTQEEIAALRQALDAQLTLAGDVA